MRQAELDWVRGLPDQVASGTLEGFQQWRALHEHGDPGAFPSSREEVEWTDRSPPSGREEI
jgi:hypothetical protein